MADCKWIIVSNRLPVQFDEQKKKLIESSGGLVTAVNHIKTKHERIWVGSAKADLAKHLAEHVDNGDGVKRGGDKHPCEKMEYHPVVIEDGLFDDYYNGYCNDTLWPMLHYESELVRHNSEKWAAYVEVNRLFAEEIHKIANNDDLIWIHDFHLFLVPRFLKKLNKKIRVGFFLHVPFPTPEIFRQLPNRENILGSLLKADLIGFHDYEYLRHFTRNVHTILGIDADMYSIRHEGHLARLGVFPVSIDTPGILKKADSAGTKKELSKLAEKWTPPLVVLGVDRLDYIKGLDLKFRAFERLLERYPAMQGKVWLIQIAVPSRTDVEDYKALRAKLEELVGSINGRFGDIAYTPIHYIFSSIPMYQLLALYRRANTLLVTSKRDGMNLVCLEYIASQDKSNPGNILLSEFAGAISTLSHVTPINPWNIDETAKSLHDALNMNLAERKSRHKPMLDYLWSYTATVWADSFMSSLDRKLPRKNNREVRNISPKSFIQMISKKMDDKKLLIFLDYDGTLVPIQNHPKDAILPKLERSLIRKLSKKRRVRLVITSGRPRAFLEQQFKNLSMEMGAEHGASYYNTQTKQWINLISSELRWYDQVNTMMENFASRIPESFVEKKEYGLCFHYRNSPKEFGQYQANKLYFELEMSMAKMPISILEGKKNIEVRAIEANKGSFCRWFLNQVVDPDSYLPIAVGDDQTDEDMFIVTKERGLALKIGGGNTTADFQMAKQSKVVEVLQSLIDLAG